MQGGWARLERATEAGALLHQRGDAARVGPGARRAGARRGRAVALVEFLEAWRGAGASGSRAARLHFPHDCPYSVRLPPTSQPLIGASGRVVFSCCSRTGRAATSLG
jgi:hypothetical protein